MSMMGDMFNERYRAIIYSVGSLFSLCALVCIETALLAEAKFQRSDQLSRPSFAL